MDRQRGLVVDRSGRKVTAVTRSGELVTFRSSREDIMPGMEVTLPVQGFTRFAWRRLAPALALSVVLIFVSVFGYQQYLYAQPLMAYVTLDCAGSVELEVNGAGLVKSATAIDEAGQEALSQVSYTNRPAQEVIAALVSLPEASKTSDVVVAVVPVKAGPGVDKLEKKVVEGAAKSPAGEEPKPVTSFRLDTETRDSAKKLGISAGRAALWALSRQIKKDDVPPETPVTTSEGPDETPGKGQGAPQPGQQGQPGQPGQSGQQGQPGEEKEDILDAIKGALPRVDPKDLKDLKERTDAKDREKYLKEITKDWFDRIEEELKSKPGKSDEQPGQSGKGSAQEGSGQGGGGQGVTPGQEPGEDKDTKGTPSKGGTSMTPSGSGSPASSGGHTAALPEVSDGQKSSDDREDGHTLQKALGELFRRFPWWRK